MLLRRSLTRSSSSVTSSLASLLMSSTIRCCIVFNVPWSSYEKTSFICKHSWWFFTALHQLVWYTVETLLISTLVAKIVFNQPRWLQGKNHATCATLISCRSMTWQRKTIQLGQRTVNCQINGSNFDRGKYLIQNFVVVTKKSVYFITTSTQYMPV